MQSSINNKGNKNMSNEYNDRIVEDIAEAAYDALYDLAVEKFGQYNAEAIEWCELQEINGWFDQKVEELWQGYPEGPL
jgi:hypothetical protein